MMKKCPCCESIKHESEFHKCSKSKDGLQWICKKCTKEKNQLWYARNRDAQREKHKKYYLQNTIKINRHRRKFYEDNRERILKQQHEKREQNLEHFREKERTYRAAHREKAAEWQRNNPNKVKQYHKKYREQNRDKLYLQNKTYRETHRDIIKKHRKERLANDPIFARRTQLQHCLWQAIRTAKTGGTPKKTSLAQSVTGLYPKELWEYLKKTWKLAYGKPLTTEKYNIDHIIPCCAARTVEELDTLFHYKNLRLLTPKDNTLKMRQDKTYELGLS